MDSILNGFVAGALFFFVAALSGLLWVLITQLVPQITRTLTAYERLAGTLEEELTPTLREVNKVVGGITELKTIAVKNVSDMSTKVEDVTGSMTKAADSAKKQSSIWGAGFLAGAKAYFDNKAAAAHAANMAKENKEVSSTSRLEAGSGAKSSNSEPR